MQPIITVSGTPYEQGRQQGEALKEVIARNVRLVEEKLAKSKVDMEFYRGYIARNAAFLERRHPEQIEEIRGIAEGAGLPYEKLLILNIPAYFLTDYFSQECSMLLVRAPASIDGNTYLIKNRDMGTYIEQCVLHRKLPQGGEIVEVNGAGTVTYPATGMNSFGLGVATTGFWSDLAKPDLEEIGDAHIFVNVRVLLEQCKTVDEVLECLKTYPRMNGLNIIAADPTQAVVIETTRDNMYIQRDNGSGVLWRTNHYMLPEISPLNPPPQKYQSTHSRYARIGEMVRERLAQGKIRFQDIWRIMSDHENGVNCICRHPSEGYPAWTASSSMVCLEDREAWTTIGNPCENLRYTKLG